MTSTIRTAAAFIVSFLLSLKIAGPVISFFDVDTATAKQRLEAGIVLVLGFVYYTLVRLLEQRWPQLSWLLGSPKVPAAYAQKDSDGVYRITTAHPAVQAGQLGITAGQAQTLSSAYFGTADISPPPAPAAPPGGVQPGAY